MVLFSHLYNFVFYVFLISFCFVLMNCRYVRLSYFTCIKYCICSIAVAILAKANLHTSQPAYSYKSSQMVAAAGATSTFCSCSLAYPAAQQGLQELELAVDKMVTGNLMGIVEHNLLSLLERERRLLSHYGAVRGLAAGGMWQTNSYDATNCIYGSVWEYWKMDTNSQKFPNCHSITNSNTAGNLLEAIMGIAWIHQHHCGDMDALSVSRACEDNVARFVDEWGLAMHNWVPVLENAIRGVEKVWHACPWIQTTRRNYDSVLAFTHLEALRLGYPSGRPFHIFGIPVLPSLDFYSKAPFWRYLEGDLEEARLVGGRWLLNAASL